MFMAQAFNGAPSPEMTGGLLLFVVLGGCVIWLFARWLMDAPVYPDPWDQQVAEGLDNADATPLCHRCLSPHDRLTNFCPRCGAPVGEYTNWLPYPYLFSVGHTMRIGTAGAYRRSAVTILGFFLLAVAEYAIFAPVYWFMLIRRLPRHEPQVMAP